MWRVAGGEYLIGTKRLKKQNQSQTIILGTCYAKVTS